MASQQEAERVIRELTGEYKLEENVYESGSKFLYELLPYADSKAFTKASARQENPYISFKIHSSHIEVEFNDDGLTTTDLEHICLSSAIEDQATGKYGLSPIFKSAAKIYIHSGNFSLDLRLSSSGGKVRPTWVTPSAPIPDELTRMAIYFHDNGTEEDLERLKNIILEQFERLKGESLLFLRTLQRITVQLYGKGGELRESKQFNKLLMKDNRVLLESSINESKKSEIYYVTDNRTGGRRNVTLAFPLTEEGKPLIDTRKKNIFNVLPFNGSGYNFLMDADFEINYQQHKLESESQRNKSIHMWIAGIFLQTLSKFRNHPSLCYEWPLFLPPISHNTPLSQDIRNMVRRHLLLKVDKPGVFRSLSEITIIPNHLRSEKGEPLLELASKDLLLLRDYPQSVVQIFKDHEANVIMQDESFMKLLEADMRRQSPKMHRMDTTQDWHARVTRLLLRLSETSALEVKSLPIVSLTDGTWTSMVSGSVYFPKTGDIPVPDSVNLRMVAPSAFQDLDRYALLSRLGVTEPPVDLVRESILKSLTTSDTIPLQVVNEYLQYLYLTHEACGWTPEQYQEVRILTRDSKLESSRSKAIYLPGKDHPFSPESLLGPAESGSSLTCSFLHPETLSYARTQGKSSNISWNRWLCDYIGIREEICLESAGTGKLSSDFLHVVSQSPGKLLDLLEHLLSKGLLELSSESTLVSEIRQLPAGNLCDVEFTPRLQDTWIPHQTLPGIVNLYMERQEQFPFLRSIQNDAGGSGTRWNFLSEHFLVGKEDNLDFRLQILRSIRRSGPEKYPDRQFQSVLYLYASIYVIFTASGKKTTDREKLRNFFGESGVVYFSGEELEWTSSSSCLWDAPANMVTMRSLKSHYDLKDSVIEIKGNLQDLFLETLSIQNTKLEHLVAELNELRIRNDVDPAQIFRLYDFLYTNMPAFVMRAVFAKSPLIFIPDGQYMGWHTSKEVLWSSSTDLCGMGTLDETYKTLRDFFVGKLGVQSLSLRILYDQLIKSPNCSPQQMKQAIFILNDFLRIEPIFLDWQPIRNAEIFPVRDPNGMVCLKSAKTDFAIGDNENLRVSFEKKISLLDFTLLEFHQLKPFFKWLKLEDRYLSRCVQEDLISISAGSLFRPPEPLMPCQKRNLKYKARYITR
ncbi:uncharacterized protein FPRN_11559 [Fusarium proliferatum]|nr:uncharacterized protein FPRN_11559 [Fusarium proliferatum]